MPQEKINALRKFYNVPIEYSDTYIVKNLGNTLGANLYNLEKAKINLGKAISRALGLHAFEGNK